jgi:hypothetical protein
MVLAPKSEIARVICAVIKAAASTVRSRNIQWLFVGAKKAVGVVLRVA